MTKALASIVFFGFAQVDGLSLNQLAQDHLRLVMGLIRFADSWARVGPTQLVVEAKQIRAVQPWAQSNEISWCEVLGLWESYLGSWHAVF